MRDHPPVDKVPLHSAQHEGAHCWWGCEHPERPGDAQCVWEPRCRACRLHLWTTLKNERALFDVDEGGSLTIGIAHADNNGVIYNKEEAPDPIEELRETLRELHGVTV